MSARANTIVTHKAAARIALKADLPGQGIVRNHTDLTIKPRFDALGFDALMGVRQLARLAGPGYDVFILTEVAGVCENGRGRSTTLRCCLGFAMRREAVILPELGTGPDQPIVISHWFASRGKFVFEGERLVEVLVGPATFDVSSPRDGRLADIRQREDDRVEPGSVLAYLAVSDHLDDADGSSQTERPNRDLG
jgi:Biotin-requiring enzyme